MKNNTLNSHNTLRSTANLTVTEGKCYCVAWSNHDACPLLRAAYITLWPVKPILAIRLPGVLMCWSSLLSTHGNTSSTGQEDSSPSVFLLTLQPLTCDHLPRLFQVKPGGKVRGLAKCGLPPAAFLLLTDPMTGIWWHARIPVKHTCTHRNTCSSALSYRTSAWQR